MILDVAKLFGDPPTRLRHEGWLPGSPPEVQDHPGWNHTACDGCREPYYACSKCATAHLRPPILSLAEGFDPANRLRCDSCGTFVEHVHPAAERPGWFPARGKVRGREVTACSAVCWVDILLQSDELLIQKLTHALDQANKEVDLA